MSQKVTFAKLRWAEHHRRSDRAKRDLFRRGKASALPSNPTKETARPIPHPGKAHQSPRAHHPKRLATHNESEQRHPHPPRLHATHDPFRPPPQAPGLFIRAHPIGKPLGHQQAPDHHGQRRVFVLAPRHVAPLLHIATRKALRPAQTEQRPHQHTAKGERA